MTTQRRCFTRLLRIDLPLAALTFLAPAASWAVPYASGVHTTTGTMREFMLNESADNVTVLRNGANPVNLGALAAGRHSFDMGAFASYAIEVTKSASAGWTTISDINNPFTNYTLPSGLAINSDPASPYFGTVYVANANPATTLRNRTMGDGIYSLTADMKGVNLANNFAAVTDANDATQAKGDAFFTVNASTSASPWRMTLDEGGNVIVSDWSDPGGGLKYLSPTLASGGLILDGDGDTANPAVHGSIAAKTYVTGRVGNNLTVYGMDEDTSPPNSIWRWDVGNATAYNQPPAQVINSSALDSVSSWISTVVGVRAGAHYSPQHDLWYLVQNRDNGNEAGLVVVQADGVDGNSPANVWDSYTFSNDPNGDLDPADALDGSTGLDGVQDVFRNIGDVTISPDGTKLLLHRIANRTDNPFQAGAVIVIPLDSEGVPDLDVAGGAITNLTTIETIGGNLAHSSGAQLEFDAAGNLYVANSGIDAATGQLVQVLSPGGSFKTTLTSAGEFTVTPVAPPANNSDFDNDGDVDGADFLTWQKNLGATGVPAGNKSTGDANGDGNVNAADLAIWQAHFGLPPSTGAGAPAPEPAAWGLAGLALAALAGLRRRR